MSKRQETITIYKCDRCGIEVDVNPFSIREDSWAKVDIARDDDNVPVLTDDYLWDLCRVCCHSLMKWKVYEE